jgi:hypothetical protein
MRDGGDWIVWAAIIIFALIVAGWVLWLAGVMK